MLLGRLMRRLLPPHLFLLCGIGATAIGLAVPVRGPLVAEARIAGTVLLAAGLAVSKRCSDLFDRSRTNIKTFDDPDVLVTTGPFRFSRNPMYLGFTIALVGASMLVGSLSAVSGPVLFWLLADRWYIPFEERRMMATFGATYERYRSAVPRWIGRRRSVQSSNS